MARASTRRPRATPVPSALPFAIRVEEVAAGPLPSLQSFAWARAPNTGKTTHAPTLERWIVLSGRGDGVHGAHRGPRKHRRVAFQAEGANRRLYVFDLPASDQDPRTRQAAIRASSISVEQAGLAVPHALEVTGAQFCEVRGSLYVIGGYGETASGQMETSGTTTRIEIAGLADAIASDRPVRRFIRQSEAPDPRLRVAGGALVRLGGRFHLVLGHQFDGHIKDFPATATETYTEQVRVFDLDRKTLRPRGYVTYPDKPPYDPARPLHRRDLNVVPTILPDGKHEKQAMTVFGGVFRPGRSSPYRRPILLERLRLQEPTPTPVTGEHPAPPPPTERGGLYTSVFADPAWHQRFNQYNCATVSLFDSRQDSMFTVFFGGMSQYVFDFDTGHEVRTSSMALVDYVSVMVRMRHGRWMECILPSALPGRLGCDAAFLPSPRPPQFRNGVLKLAHLTGPTAIGYIYGGIRPRGRSTTASNRLFRVVVVPAPSPAYLVGL